MGVELRDGRGCLDIEFAALAALLRIPDPRRWSACEDLKNIVKRECGLCGGESRSVQVVFGKHTVVGPETVLPLVFL